MDLVPLLESAAKDVDAYSTSWFGHGDHQEHPIPPLEASRDDNTYLSR